MLNWISVKDQLPPTDTPIWVWTDKPVETNYLGAVDVHAWITSRTDNDLYAILHDADGGYIYWYDVTVTHWAYIVGPNGEVQQGCKEN